MPSSSQIRWACYRKWSVEWEAKTEMCRWLTFTIENSCGMYCPGHAGVKGNDRADRLAGKATHTSGLLLGRSEVLRSLRHYLRAQNQEHHTIDRLEERGVERGSAGRSSFKGRERAIVFKGDVGETFWETGWSGCGLFRAHGCHLELNWSEQRAKERQFKICAAEKRKKKNCCWSKSCLKR